jgi:hypothetical protein
MANGETWLQQLAREAREGKPHEGNAAVKPEQKEAAKANLRKVAQPANEVLCNGGGKKDKAWWKEYRKKPVICPKCGHEFTELKRKKV